MTIARRTVLKGLAAGAALAAAPAAEARERRRRHADDVGLLYDSLRCIGCRACVTRCKEANGLPYDVVRADGAVYDAPPALSATTKTIIQLAFDERGGSAFVKSQCMHCVHPACTSVCMLGALHKGEKGVVAYDVERCVGCRYCQVACPFNVPKFEWSKAAPRIVKCELCRHRWPEGKGAACAEVCPRGAVVFGRVEELKAEARRRIGEIKGRYLSHVYGESEGGGTQVLVLSAVPFERLGLPKLDDAPTAELGETIQAGIYNGMVAPAALLVAFGAAVLRNRKRGAGQEEEP